MFVMLVPVASMQNNAPILKINVTKMMMMLTMMMMMMLMII